MYFARIAVAGICILSASAPGFSQTLGLAGSPGQLRYVHERQAVPVQHATSILQEITDTKAVSKNTKKSEWLDQLGTIYAGMNGQTIWTDANGYTAKAQTVIDELRRADEWGLRPSQYTIPAYPTLGLTTNTLAKMEVGLSLSVLKYSWHAHGGRIEPTQLSLWLDRTPRPMDGVETLQLIASSSDPRAQLLKVHPQHPQFERLRQAYLTVLYPQKYKKKKSREDIRLAVKGPKLRPGAKHPDIAVIRHRLGVLAVRRDAEVYTKELVAAVNRYMRTQGWKRKRVVDNSVRNALNNPKQNMRKMSRAQKIALLQVNLEKWRWMPDNLGSLHIWNNLPTFRTNVVKNGAIIHTERIIIGKNKSQTPVFSDKMTHIVFKPEWGVPSSIKIRSILPRLAGGDYGVLARRGMSIKYDNGVVKHPSRFNWSRTDIRSVPIVMAPGSSNPLGRVKFIFPNQHSVYMHDTPTKHLFKDRTRNFSHGCIRVRNPLRLAEILLDETSGWDKDQVATQLKSRAPGNNKIPLPQPIPVHNVYFTVEVDAATGKIKRLKDVYGHDKRITAALNGKPATQIAKSDPARAQLATNEQLASAPNVYRARRKLPRRMSLGAPAAFAQPPPGFYWGKPKKPKWKPWKQAKPAKYKRRRARRYRRRRAVPANPFQVFY